MVKGRALHFVFKVGNRAETMKFFLKVLGMKVLRHEEFEEGCKASCNGPYDGRWSKTMVGYGPEDTHFVVELTYNYGLGSYQRGNDFRGITLRSSQVLERASSLKWPIEEEANLKVVRSPDGYPFFIRNECQLPDKDPVEKVSLSSSNLAKSLAFWHDVLGLKVYKKDEKTALLGYADDQVKLELEDIGMPVEHAKAYGRIAFSCPFEEQPGIEEIVKQKGYTVLTPLVSLDTPGKAAVRVVIVADPDGHEICFVDDESFRQLSQVDRNAESLLEAAMNEDKSAQWFADRGKTKAEA